MKVPRRNDYSADRLMTNMSLTLISDFRDLLGDPCFADKLHTYLRSGDIAGIREETSAVEYDGSAIEFKARYQIASLFKRYRYQSDIYSDAELVEKASNDFLETQHRLANIDYNATSSITRTVLRRAANYISKVLGEYSDEEHRRRCRFGSGASVGVPASAASLAARWEPPISGSKHQISWFDSEMSQYPCVQEYWTKRKGSDPNGSTYQEVDELKLVLVPKTFKALRSIMPNTTIGSYHSYGLGEMIRMRLKRVGYDIKTLQSRHRYYAQQGSIHGLWMTADLSSASDSLTTRLVELLLPPAWFKVMNDARIGLVRLPDDSVVQMETFCTMGIGYTFPLQTLVFLALLKAIESTQYSRYDRRLISVYGDDLVFNPRMYDIVRHVFQQIGLILNVEKTFADGPFRESCGGDYYRGVDVRPFQPRSGPAVVGKRAYEAILYKAINGLLRRWSEYEISTTLNYLTSEVEKVTGRCKVVPYDFPDDAGIRCSLRPFKFLEVAKIASRKHIGHGLYRFSYLRFVSEEREEVRHEPYLWDALNGIHSSSRKDYWATPERSRDQDNLSSEIDRRLGISTYEPQLHWREASANLTTRSKTSGRRLRRLVSFVTTSHKGTYKRQSGISCFESRS